jgi:hypothetical protein
MDSVWIKHSKGMDSVWGVHEKAAFVLQRKNITPALNEPKVQ